MKSLHFKLFARYALLIFSILLVFITLFYTTQKNTLQVNAKNELQADCDNISTLLDSQIDQLDSLSKRIVSSKQLQNLFIEDLYSSTVDAYHRKSEFSDILFDIIRLSFTNTELNILDTNGRYIHVGSMSTFEMRDPAEYAEISWFTPTLEAYGKKQIIPPHIPETNISNNMVISLCRAFSPENSRTETAILEMQLQYSFISQLIQNATHNQKGIKEVYVYDQAGALIYPFDTPPAGQTMSHIMEVLSEPEVSEKPVISKTSGRSPILFAHQYSNYTNWTIFVAASEKEALSSFYDFRFLLILLSFAALILLLFLTDLIATNLAMPLKKLEQTVCSLTFDNLDSNELSNFQSNFKELDSLYHSFEQMRVNLQNSLQETVSAHTIAVDAKLLALQSQMNPHFLYNTLASISILAEEGEYEKIMETCDNLSMLLRYISSNSPMSVQLWQEIEHTRSYMKLIEIKYEERIHFHLDIDKTLYSLHVPKLILQPLVENCVKYALNVNPPWIISISGFIENQNWILQVKDNGPGFSQEYLNQIHKDIETYNSNAPLPDLAINGMGLLNLYMRLFLLYKKHVIFRLENNSDGGACVTIGGFFEKTKEENKDV